MGPKEPAAVAAGFVWGQEGRRGRKTTNRASSNSLPHFSGQQARLAFQCVKQGAAVFMPENPLTITDNRTGQTYTVPVENGTIRAMNLRQIKTGPDDFGLMTYDPAFMNTASCRSSITYIDGDLGILRYRGYPIEVLAERCTFLEVAYLLLFGELPTNSELHTSVHAIP